MIKGGIMSKEGDDMLSREQPAVIALGRAFDAAVAKFGVIRLAQSLRD